MFEDLRVHVIIRSMFVLALMFTTFGCLSSPSAPSDVAPIDEGGTVEGPGSSNPPEPPIESEPPETQSSAHIPSSFSGGDIVIEAGRRGEWDLRIDGAISPASVIKKDGRFFLYYIGADGNRSDDNGPRHRALGVATSRDGIHYEKYAGNPVLTFLPHNEQEEGVFSLGATVDDDGSVVIHYTACATFRSGSVNCDGRVAVSRNGFEFEDRGMAIDHGDRNVWGSGDEIFTIGSYQHDDTWYVYYLASSQSVDRYLGVAWGDAPDNLTQSRGVLTSGERVWGGADPIWMSDDELALFINRENGEVDVRMITPDRPDRLSDTQARYRGEMRQHTTVFYDEDSQTWFMYYMDSSDREIRVKTASNPTD